ncbi:hypothetical protein T261_05312 [Streptomyces lydicus]|nr:hypothetical protein T261_05312 [Streptomyces lydicus]
MRDRDDHGEPGLHRRGPAFPNTFRSGASRDCGVQLALRRRGHRICAERVRRPGPAPGRRAAAPGSPLMP